LQQQKKKEDQNQFQNCQMEKVREGGEAAHHSKQKRVTITCTQIKFVLQSQIPEYPYWQKGKISNRVRNCVLSLDKDCNKIPIQKRGVFRGRK
jgi:hypothetical protein